VIAPWLVSLPDEASGQPFPPVPTREAVCGVQCASMNTCPTVVTQQIGTVPFWDPVLVCLTNPQDRAAGYAAKLALGDTHVILEYNRNARPLYDEGGQPYQATITTVNEQTPAAFLALVEETILAGFTPLIALDGDAGEDPTYGYPNAARQLPILVALLKTSRYGDLNAYVLIGALYDGVFYGWTPEHIGDFGQQFRALSPNGYLAIEHSSGHIPCGEGNQDWLPVSAGGTGRMLGYDVLLSEFDYANSVPPNDTIWQIAARTLGPSYRRPPDQPADDDPGSPFPVGSGKYYLSAGTPRGPWFVVAFEWEGTYFRVRNQSTVGQEAARRRYMQAAGYRYTG